MDDTALNAVAKETRMTRFWFGMLSVGLLGLCACGDEDADLGEKFDRFVESEAQFERRSCQCEGDSSCDEHDSKELMEARSCIVSTLMSDPAGAAFLDCVNAAASAAVQCLAPSNVCSSEQLRDDCDDRFEDQVDGCFLPDALEDALDECD